ncbi:MAG TPA: C40 family peptidase [Cyclobacteriaceae bacterium]|nr:C40 family peptidase [Cyclobacteriaceae bacterium]
MTSPIDFGVCRLAIVAVRKDADHKSEVVTQLLFGDHYQVFDTSKDKKWIHVMVHSDETTGWIEELQHHSISFEYFQQIGLANFKITTDVASTILYKKTQLTIVMGSIVPISGSELFKMEEQFAFNGEAKSLGQRRDYEYLRSISGKYINAPQIPGGKSPFGIDAPGFVQMAFKLTGYQLPRDAAQQANAGKPLESLNEVQPGDVALFKGKDGKFNHVGIVLDEQKIIHCHGRVKIDYLMEDGILNSETKIYTHTSPSFRRILS